MHMCCVCAVGKCVKGKTAGVNYQSASRWCLVSTDEVTASDLCPDLCRHLSVDLGHFTTPLLASLGSHWFGNVLRRDAKWGGAEVD